MVVFTHTVKKIKDVAYKNGDVDGTCKQAFMLKSPKKSGKSARNVSEGTSTPECITSEGHGEK